MGLHILTVLAVIVLARSQVYGSPLQNNYTRPENNDDTNDTDLKCIFTAGHGRQGVYTLQLGHNKSALIPCEVEDGKVLSVIMRRVNGQQSFIQNYQTYVDGFGNHRGSFWIGLETIYHLAKDGRKELLITMVDWTGTVERVVYSQFYLEPSDKRYKLHVGSYKGSLPDELYYHNNMPFSTYDAPDEHGCAATMGAGWWYNYCARTLLNGIYYSSGAYASQKSLYDGIFWRSFHGEDYSLKTVTMSLI